MTTTIDQQLWLRQHTLPTIWCAGCGIGIVLGALLRAVADLGWDQNKTAMVAGIGCSGRMATYPDLCTLHTTHGRALPFATGLKLARPEMNVIVVMGDGDALAIGGNHFIHTARRNLDLTAIVINNCIYGMTGGQVSPTTPVGDRASTAPYGQVEPAFDIPTLAEAAGAAFIARGTVYHVLELKNLLRRALAKKGFSVLEAIAHCHVQYGVRNAMPTAAEMMRWQRDNTVSAAAAARGRGAPGKLRRGVLCDRDLPEFGEQYRRLVAQLQETT